MLDGALALPEYIIEFDFSPEMGKVRDHFVMFTQMSPQYMVFVFYMENRI